MVSPPLLEARAGSPVCSVQAGTRAACALGKGGGSGGVPRGPSGGAAPLLLHAHRRRLHIHSKRWRSVACSARARSLKSRSRPTMDTRVLIAQVAWLHEKPLLPEHLGQLRLALSGMPEIFVARVRPHGSAGACACVPQASVMCAEALRSRARCSMAGKEAPRLQAESLAERRAKVRRG